MSAVWRNFTIEARHEIVAIIDEFSSSTPTGEKNWSNNNVRKLLKYCSLDDIPKIRASYMMEKIDPGVMVGIYSAIEASQGVVATAAA
jgi:hypothetical protein